MKGLSSFFLILIILFNIIETIAAFVLGGDWFFICLANSFVSIVILVNEFMIKKESSEDKK